MSYNGTKKDVYQMVTDEVLAMLDKGVAPWRKTWKSGFKAPKNFVTRKEYRSMNWFLLSFKASDKGYTSNYWLTFKQAKDHGGNVKRGEKGTIVCFWKLNKYMKTDTETGKQTEKTIPFLRYYTVFNLDQTENVTLTKPIALEKLAETEDLNDHTPIEACEAIVAGFEGCPTIENSVDGRAYYAPMADEVHVPNINSFETSECYYGVLFHELVHSTGHSSRLDRVSDRSESNAAFGSVEYSKEELVAEMGSCFLCAIAGIDVPDIENSVAYIDGWRKRISEDKKLVINAAAKAQKAADYIKAH
jgi:antirestriction protein ArdC